MADEKDGFYWVAMHGEKFEPALVEFKDGKPCTIWCIGSDVQYDPFQAVIGERIIRKGN